MLHNRKPGLIFDCHLPNRSRGCQVAKQSGPLDPLQGRQPANGKKTVNKHYGQGVGYEKLDEQQSLLGLLYGFTSLGNTLFPLGWAVQGQGRDIPGSAETQVLIFTTTR